jgi:hypothetical protein
LASYKKFRRVIWLEIHKWMKMKEVFLN